jgi:hypothetical protein
MFLCLNNKNNTFQTLLSWRCIVGCTSGDAFVLLLPVAILCGTCRVYCSYYSFFFLRANIGFENPLGPAYFISSMGGAGATEDCSVSKILVACSVLFTP